MTNFIILCIDCLRYDRLFHNSNLAPFLKALVKNKGFSFEKAYSAAPWTYPATNSILTGLYPHNHGAYQKGIYKENVLKPWPSRLYPSTPTIFSELKKHRYYNLGISTIFWSLNNKCEYSGCDKIIRSDEQEVFYKNTNAEWVVQNFIETYDSEIGENPFFAFLHFIDLHRPYDLDRAINHSLEPIKIMDGIEEWDIRPYVNDPEKVTEFKENKVKLYDALINYVDIQIEALVRFLQNRGIDDSTVIIVTADHGEEFWDHEEIERKNYSCGLKSKKWWLMGTGHGHTLFNELVHVPLILINPNVEIEPKALLSPVSTIDIYPTLFDMIDDTPTGQFDGQSLFSCNPQRDILIESILYGFEKKALLKNSMKCIYSLFENRFEHYDLSNDPQESHPSAEVVDEKMLSRLKLFYRKQFNVTDKIRMSLN